MPKTGTGSKRKRIGDIVAIPLEGGVFGFGRVLPEPLMAFYNLRLSIITDIDEIREAPILFSIWVMKSTNIWTTIGNAPLEESLLKAPRFFKEDPITGRLTIYSGGFDKGVPASADECNGLERAAVWDAHQIVDRLNDFFAGRPCKWIRGIGARKT